MKSIVLGVILTLSGIFLLLTILGIHGQSYRKVNEQTTLEQTVEAAINELLDQGIYEKTNQEEFIVQFLENTITGLNGEAAIKVEIASADLEKGILSVRVTQTYQGANGKEHSLSYETTALIERETSKEYCKVQYQDQNGKVIRSFYIQEGQGLILPKESPSISGKSFVGWQDESGKYGYKGFIVKQDLAFKAVYK